VSTFAENVSAAEFERVVGRPAVTHRHQQLGEIFSTTMIVSMLRQ